MKKLAFFFIILISLIFVAGCNRSKDNSVSNNEEVKKSETIVKKIEEEPAEDSEVFTLDLSKNDQTKKEAYLVEILPKEAYLKTDKDYLTLSGKSTEAVKSIAINGIKLKGFKGNEWKYIISSSLGNLKEGRNEYIIQALNEKDELLEEINRTIDYQGEKIEGKLASTGMGLEIPLLISGVAGFIATRRRLK